MQVLTMGQAAKLLRVAPRTVCKWFDSGRLKEYRIPGSQDRRTTKQYLLDFCREYGLTIPSELLDEPVETVDWLATPDNTGACQKACDITNSIFTLEGMQSAKSSNPAGWSNLAGQVARLIDESL